MMTLFNLIFLLGIIILSTTLLGQCNGFTVPQANLVATKYGARRPMEVVATTSSSETMAKTSSWMLSSSRTTILNAHYASSAASSDDDNSNHDDRTIRDKLRKLTGFSLTAFRATARAATGISLTAVYASTLAVTGLWVRSIMSVILSIFPAWFRYFLQPFLVLYYAPLFIIRGLTGPSRRVAQKKRDSFMEGWKQAVDYAEKAEADGYWPVHANDEGYFELVKPPNPDDEMPVEGLEDAIAESVEDFMESKDGSTK